MGKLRIEEVENGFIVYDHAEVGMIGRTWAFENEATLTAFISKWGKDIEDKRGEEG